MPDRRCRKLSAVRSAISRAAGRADDSGDLVAGRAPVAVVLWKRDLDSRIDLTERLDGDVEAGQHAVDLDEKHAARATVGGDGRLRRDVAGADVLVERPADDVTIVFRV